MEAGEGGTVKTASLYYSAKLCLLCLSALNCPNISLSLTARGRPLVKEEGVRSKLKLSLCSRHEASHLFLFSVKLK